MDNVREGFCFSSTKMHLEKRSLHPVTAWWGSIATSAGLRLLVTMIGQRDSASHGREGARPRQVG